MSTLSEFMEERAQAGGGRERSRVRSTSRGPVVVLRGWRKGMDKVAVIQLLRKHGVPLAEAHEATEHVLQGQIVSVHLEDGSNAPDVCRELDQLGIVL